MGKWVILLGGGAFGPESIRRMRFQGYTSITGTSGTTMTPKNYHPFHGRTPNVSYCAIPLWKSSHESSVRRIFQKTY